MNPEISRIILEWVGTRTLMTSNSSQFGLGQSIPREVQVTMYEYARKVVGRYPLGFKGTTAPTLVEEDGSHRVYVDHPTWQGLFPLMDDAPLAEFGAWVADGMPVYVNDLWQWSAQVLLPGDTRPFIRVDSVWSVICAKNKNV